MTDLVSLWPQRRVELNCLVTIGMDITAPFLGDMGLWAEPIEPFRGLVRHSIDENLDIFSGRGDEAAVREGMLRLDSLMQSELPVSTRSAFWSWIRDTYTSLPADRPDWERYEMFFFQWSVGMRDGEDTASCFRDSVGVFQAHNGFVRLREPDGRIKVSRGLTLSTWDQKIFQLRRYALSEEEAENVDEYSDPFGVVDASVNRHHFQQFWEYLLPQLSSAEQQLLYEAMWEYYRRMSFLKELVRPDQLSRETR